MNYTVTIDYDYDTDSPCVYDGTWKVYSFNSRDSNYMPHSKVNGQIILVLLKT